MLREGAAIKVPSSLDRGKKDDRKHVGVTPNIGCTGEVKWMEPEVHV